MYVYVSSSSISFKKHLRHLFLITISILGNSMICSDIWHKYRDWYFEIVMRNFMSR